LVGNETFAREKPINEEILSICSVSGAVCIYILFGVVIIYKESYMKVLFLEKTRNRAI